MEGELGVGDGMGWGGGWFALTLVVVHHVAQVVAAAVVSFADAH